MRRDWKLVADKDIPCEPVSLVRARKNEVNYLYVPINQTTGRVSGLGRNCFIAYALLTTAEAMHPREKWHTLPHRHLGRLDVSRFRLYRAMDTLEAAGIVESKRQPGKKTLYKLR